MQNLTVLLLLSIQILISAQPAPIKWKDISMEDLKMTEYKLDPSADAVVLCDYGQMYFDVNKSGGSLFFITERHVRIKILNEEGRKYAKVRIPFLNLHCESFQWENKLTIYAWSHNLSDKGKKISKKLKFKDVKFIDSTNCYQIAEFTIPNVKPGSVIEYRYKISSLEMIYPESWYFQTSIPVKYSEFRIQVPNDFQYILSPVNIQNFDINERHAYSRTLNVDIVRSTLKAKEERNTGYYDDHSDQYERVKQRIVIDLSGEVFRFAKKNLPAFQNYKFIDNANDNKQKLNIHLAQITKSIYFEGWEDLTRELMITTDRYYDTKTIFQKESIPYPIGYYVYKLPDWKLFSEELLKDERFGLPLIMHWDYESSLNEIIKGKDTQIKKIAAIYDYIRKNIRWDGVYDVYADRVSNVGVGKIYKAVTHKEVNHKTLQKVFTEGLGSSSEINFILIYLLNKAGIETHPVLISTRDNGAVDMMFPDIEQFNHVVAYTKIDDEILFLDAIDSLRPYNLLNINTAGVKGFLVRAKDQVWLNVENQKLSNTKTNVHYIINDLGKISGKLKTVYRGYDALRVEKEQKNSIADELQSVYKSYSLNNLQFNKNQDENYIIIQADINKNGASEEIHIQPAFACKYTEGQFTEYMRTFPVEFDFPYEKSYETSIKIPDNYEFEYPQNTHFGTYGNNAEFIYEIDKQGDELNLKINISIKIHEFPAHEYSNLAEFFGKVNDKLQEKITISKKD